MEVLVIKYEFNVKLNCFQIVTDYANIEQKKDERTFIKLTFDKVTNYKRKDLNQSFQHCLNEYSLLKEKRTIVIQDFVFRENEDDWYAEFWLGHSLGEITFNFKTLLYKEKDTKAVNNNNEWEYIELATQKAMDFYNPFDDVYSSI